MVGLIFKSCWTISKIAEHRTQNTEHRTPKNIFPLIRDSTPHPPSSSVEMLFPSSPRLLCRQIYRQTELGFLNVSWGRKSGVDLSLPPFFSMNIKFGIFEHTKKGGSWRSSQLWLRHKYLSSEIWVIPNIYSLLPPFSHPSSHMLSVQSNRNKGAIWENQLQILSPHTIL